MTDESAFHASISAEPNNHAMRLVFADWLEERGDWRAVGYRWMGELHRHPEPHYSAWAWRSPKMTGFKPYDIPSQLEGEVWEFVRQLAKDAEKASKRVYYNANAYRTCSVFPTLQDAEEALCRAVIACNAFTVAIPSLA